MTNYTHINQRAEFTVNRIGSGKESNLIICHHYISADFL